MKFRTGVRSASCFFQCQLSERECNHADMIINIHEKNTHAEETGVDHVCI